MEDYIDALLMYLSEQRFTTQSGAYLSSLTREEAASEALRAALNDSQKSLFLAYEEARNATASIAEDEYARAAFLLAKEIFS